MESKRSETFLAQAQRCKAVARLMSTSDGKREFEKLAGNWLRLAEIAKREESQIMSRSRKVADART